MEAVETVEEDKRIEHPAFCYHGGKWRKAPWIISHFPKKHTGYIEPCGGAASVLLRKPRVAFEVFNDLDHCVVNFFRVLREEQDELIRQIRLTPWSREEHMIARSPDVDASNVENARRFFVSAWTNIGAVPHIKSKTGMRMMLHGDNKKSPAFTWARRIEGDHLLRVAARFRGVQIENKDILYILEKYNYPHNLAYCDPPFLFSTRTTNEERYFQEWTVQKHVKTAYLLHNFKGYAVISGYPSDLYAGLYEGCGWKRIDRECGVGFYVGTKKTESIWLSPRTVEALEEEKEKEQDADLF